MALVCVRARQMSVTWGQLLQARPVGKAHIFVNSDMPNKFADQFEPFKVQCSLSHPAVSVKISHLRGHMNGCMDPNSLHPTSIHTLFRVFGFCVRDFGSIRAWLLTPCFSLAFAQVFGFDPGREFPGDGHHGSSGRIWRTGGESRRESGRESRGGMSCGIAALNWRSDACKRSICDARTRARTRTHPSTRHHPTLRQAP